MDRELFLLRNLAADTPTTIGRGQQEQRVAESAVVDEILHRAVERDEDVQVGKRSQEWAPHHRLPADPGAEDPLPHGGTDAELGQGVQGDAPPSRIHSRV
jgi:hypothetical protein